MLFKVVLAFLSLIVILVKCDPPCHKIIFNADGTKLVKIGFVSSPKVDFQKKVVQLPENLSDLLDCIDPKEKNTKLMLRYRSLGSKDWKKHQFVYPTVVSETPVEVEIPGEPCQIYEIKLRHKKLELKLPDVQFGPENSVKNVEIQQISSNSIKIGWSGESMQCASGFKLSSQSWGSMILDNKNSTEWSQHGLTPCKSYSLEIEPIFENIYGETTQIKFDTFPNQTFFNVKQTEKGIEYTEDNIRLCKSIQLISYKLHASRQDLLEDKLTNGVLKKQTFFYEMKDGQQIFSTEDIEREIISKQMIGTCKSYLINITAEIEDSNHYKSTVYLVQNLKAQTDSESKLTFSDENVCTRKAKSNMQVKEAEYVTTTVETNTAIQSTTTETDEYFDAYIETDENHDENTEFAILPIMTSITTTTITTTITTTSTSITTTPEETTTIELVTSPTTTKSTTTSSIAPTTLEEEIKEQMVFNVNNEITKAEISTSSSQSVEYTSGIEGEFDILKSATTMPPSVEDSNSEEDTKSSIDAVYEDPPEGNFWTKIPKPGQHMTTEINKDDLDNQYNQDGLEKKDDMDNQDEMEESASIVQEVLYKPGGEGNISSTNDNEEGKEDEEEAKEEDLNENPEVGTEKPTDRKVFKKLQVIDTEVRHAGANSSPIVAASVVAILALVVIVIALSCMIYRKRKEKCATTFPVWESNERGQFDKCQSLEDYSFKEEKENEEPFISNSVNEDQADAKVQSNV